MRVPCGVHLPPFALPGIDFASIIGSMSFCGKWPLTIRIQYAVNLPPFDRPGIISSPKFIASPLVSKINKILLTNL